MMTRLALVLSLALAVPALAQQAAAEVSVVDPYVRLPPPGALTTGAFFVLKSHAKVAHRLVKAHNDASKVTELHTHVNEGGVMKMRPVPFMEVPAGGETKLQPGGLHVMMIELTRPLAEGEKVPLTLTFEDGSTSTVQAVVRKLDLGAMKMKMKGH